jgi:WD40 repeat protein
MEQLTFQAGGAVSETSLYVERHADNELYTRLMRSEFCYVLAPRQIGKSSLKIRTFKRLRAAGVHCALIDLNAIGVGSASVEQWYRSLINEILKPEIGLKLTVDINQFWVDNRDLPPLQRWLNFLYNVVLKEIDGNVVIFIDEIDSILSLNPRQASDDFFAALKGLFDSRPAQPRYQRLTFCFSGVAKPQDLIADAVRTPFNVGKQVRLEDFTPKEMQSFLPIFQLISKNTQLQLNAQLLLDKIYEWTSGHPYMTQRIFEELYFRGDSEDFLALSPQEQVDQLVTEYFLLRGRTDDSNLSYAEKRVEAISPAQKARVLQLYRRLLQGENIRLNTTDPLQLELKLAGMVAERRTNNGDFLKPRNRIYQEVYNLEWVKEKQAKRFLSEGVEQWLQSGKSEDFLLRGQALSYARQAVSGEDVSRNERDFLLASQELATRILAEQNQTELGHLRAQWEQERARMQELLAALQRDYTADLERLEQQLAQTKEKAEQYATEAKNNRVALYQEQGYQEFIKGDYLLASLYFLAGYKLASPDRTSLRFLLALSMELVEQQKFSLIGHAGGVWSASYAPDGSQIVTASEDGTAKVWEASSGKLLVTLAGHEDWVMSAKYAPDGKRIVTGSRDKTAKVWEASSGKLLVTLAGHEDWVISARYAPDGKRIVTGSDDKTAKVWEASSGKPLVTLAGHEAEVISARYAPDGKRIVTGSWDKTAKMWEANSGKLLVTLAGHEAEVISARYAPDGKRIVTGSADKTAKVWEASSGKLLVTLAGHEAEVISARYAPDGKRIVTGSADKTAKVWEASSGKLLVTLAGHEARVSSASYAPDGKRIVTGSADKTAKVWEASSGKLLVTLAGHEDWVRSARYAPDGSQIVTGSDDGTAKVWEASSGKLLVTLAGHEDWVRSARYAPDGKRIVTGSRDKTAKVWEANSGKLLVTLAGHEEGVMSASYAPDGKRIVTASEDGTAKVWEASSGKLLVTLAGHEEGVMSASYAPDGKRIVTGSDDGTAKVWEASSGKLLVTLAGHEAEVISASYAPDGSRIVTGSLDNTAKVWEASSGKLLVTLAGHEGGVESASYAPDGKRIVTGSLDNTAKVWDVHLETRPPEELEEIIKTRVPYRLEQGVIVPAIPER